MSIETEVQLRYETAWRRRHRLSEARFRRFASRDFINHIPARDGMPDYYYLEYSKHYCLGEMSANQGGI